MFKQRLLLPNCSAHCHLQFICPLPSTNLNSYNFRDLPSILLLKILTDEVEAKKAKNERTDLKSKEATEKEFKQVAKK